MNERVVGMVADGVAVKSDTGVVIVPWSALMQGHQLIQDKMSFHIGVRVGMEIQRIQAANDS